MKIVMDPKKFLIKGKKGSKIKWVKPKLVSNGNED
jgi:hypothetical protein